MSQESSNIIILKDEKGMGRAVHMRACVFIALIGKRFCRRKIGLDTLKRAEILHKRRRSARETDRHSLSIELRNSVRISYTSSMQLHASSVARRLFPRSFHCGITSHASCTTRTQRRRSVHRLKFCILRIVCAMCPLAQIANK
jgi:hypothetical protein